MGQTRLSQIVGFSVLLTLIIAGVWVTHHQIKTAIAAHKSKALCVKLAESVPRCYPSATQLTSQLTTAIATDVRGAVLVSTTRNRIDVWNLATGKRLRSLVGQRQWVSAIAIRPDGNILASGSVDGTIQVWDLSTGRLVTSWAAKPVTALAFSPDGSMLASGSRLVETAHPRYFRPIQLWDVATGRWIATITPQEPVSAIAFSPDGQRIAAGSAHVKVWDLATQRLSYTVQSGDVKAIMFSADGHLLLTGGEGVQGEDGIKFWRADSGALVRVLDSAAGSFALSPDGRLLLTTYGGSANLWRMQPFGYLGTVQGSEYSSVVAKFGLNGTAIATGGSDGIHIWRSQPASTQQPTSSD